MTAASGLLHGGAAAVCFAWTALVLATGRGPSARLLALAGGVSGLWAAAVALAPEDPLRGIAGTLEILRLAVWFALLLSLHRRVAGPRARPLLRRFALGGAAVAALALLSLLSGPALLIGVMAPLARPGTALLVVLLAENLYRNADEAARWHVNLPCIALGGLAAFDLLLYADSALSGVMSPALLDARAALTALVTPLLAIAAVRDGRWRRDPPASRQAVFHGTTLVVAGAFLLGVGALGEALRQFGASWGPTVQTSMLAGAVLALSVAAASGTARSRLRHLVVDHFFTARYDYRREWLRCVTVLSTPDDQMPAAQRAIRAVADPVDSPAGVLLVRDPGEAGLRWAGSWNLPAGPVTLPAGHPLLAAFGEEGRILAFGPGQPAPADLQAALGPLWLAVPLVHHRDGPVGAVLLAAPRAAFPLDREVFELLRTIASEVAMFLAERRAAERLAEQRPLQDYARRFAFVAHDVKTVASQLTLLLANAEDNLQDPEFQHDMLLTVRAAAGRINTLIARLRQPGEPMEEAPAMQRGATVAPLERLHALAAAQPHPVRVEEADPPVGLAAITPERFDAAAAHLLNNAVEASAPDEPVRIGVRAEAGRILVDIADRGPGMTPEFIRDELFRPLSTSKPQGSGIGAWQARELLREAGGDLTVISRPGAGTTMRLVLPAAAGAAVAATAGEGRA